MQDCGNRAKASRFYRKKARLDWNWWSIHKVLIDNQPFYQV
jgi:hypothetical protein